MPLIPRVVKTEFLFFFFLKKVIAITVDKVWLQFLRILLRVMRS